jgi:hypothetical protein
LGGVGRPLVFWYKLSIFFIRKIARLGSINGIIGWITLTFWLLDNFYLIFGTSILASPPGYVMTIRNCIGAAIAGLVIASSHNLFPGSELTVFSRC